MSIKNNKDVLLRWLNIRDTESYEVWSTGPEIQEETQLRVEDLNDAVEILYEEGLITRINALGTSPYNFAQIRINPRGKYEVQSEDSNGLEPIQDARKKLLFFSYSSKDRQKVGKICDILVEQYNIDVFRAHDTIEVTHDWRERIKENLDKCDGLVAYVTRNFRNSEWTYQECGWVAGRGIPIYSLFIMKKLPNGFLEELQGTRITHHSDPSEIAHKIGEVFQ